MEALEKMLLDKGISTELIQKMQLLEHELLKLQEAKKQQGKESKREATPNIREHPKLTPKQQLFKEMYFNTNEILNRDAIPLSPIYKIKIKQYFKSNSI